MERVSENATAWIGSPASLVFHSIFFLFCFCLPFFGVELEKMLLVLTTVVSLEAIYLSIFIQMTVNRNTASLKEVEEDIEDIQEDVEEIEKEVEEIGEDVEEIGEELEDLGEDVEELADIKPKKNQKNKKPTPPPSLKKFAKTPARR